jgi:predicted CoA-binding protein
LICLPQTTRAARRAEEAGLDVVMDRCILKDHRRLAQAR